MRKWLGYLAITAVLAALASLPATGQGMARLFGTNTTTGAAVPVGVSGNALLVSVGGGSGVSGLTFANGGYLRTGTTDADTMLLQAYDTDTGPGYVTMLTLTAGTTPTIAIPVQKPLLFGTNIGITAQDTAEMYFSAGATYATWLNPQTGIRFTSVGAVQWSSSATSGYQNIDTYLTRENAAILQLGVDAAGTTAYTLKGNDRITSDGVGGDLTIAAGRGLGGAGGSLYFQTATTGATGVAGTLTNRLIIGNLGAVTVGATAGTGAGALYADTYYTGTTAGCTGTPTVATKGIATTCTEPIPDPLTAAEISELRGLLNANRTK